MSQASTPPKFFVPYINEDMVERFFRRNKHLAGIEVDLIDNRDRGAGLPLLYNEIIETHLDKDQWLFFVHEDFEVLSALPDISGLSPDAVYGTFGVRLEGHTPVAYGRHTCSRKDGTHPDQVGLEISRPTWVDTIDCMAILLHTSLLRRLPGLRFDEMLSFDLYCEEFCLNAQENHGLPVLVMPLHFQHYSPGKITSRYHRGLEHLAKCYPDSALPGSCSFIGGRAADLEANFTYNIEANR